MRRLYNRKLEREIRGQKIPKHIMIIVRDEIFFKNTETFVTFAEWCKRFSIEEITIAINSSKSESGRLFEIAKMFNERINADVNVICEGLEFKLNGDSLTLNLNFGLRGRREIVNAAKKIAELVIKNEIDPDDVNEKTIERFLKIKSEPDIIIRAGDETQDFLIWQSIYSEHVFFDTDWKNLRYTDFLRILRDYQRRERRYGR